MPTASAIWRVDWTQPADTRRELVFRAMLVLPLSTLPLGALGWLVQRVREEGIPHDDFGNVAFVDLIIAALFVLVALALGGALLWLGVASLVDGLGAERTVEGEVRDLEAYRFGNRTTWSMRVGGQYVVVPEFVFGQLREGQVVRVRVSRLRRTLVELSLPAGSAPLGLGF